MELSMQDIEALRPNHSGYACTCGEHIMFNRLLKIAGVKSLFTFVYIRGDFDRRHLPAVHDISSWFSTYDEAETELAAVVAEYNRAHTTGTPLVVEDYVICRSTATPLYPLDRPGSRLGPLSTTGASEEMSLANAIREATRVLGAAPFGNDEGKDTRTVEVPRWALGVIIGAARRWRRQTIEEPRP